MTNNDILEENGKPTSGNLDNQDVGILIEFITGEGLRPVGLFSSTKEPELAEKSNRAMTKAMDTIKNMAQRVHNTIRTIDNRPTNVEVQFGIKFDAEVGVLIAKANVESGMTVKMIWENTREIAPTSPDNQKFQDISS